MDAFLSSHIDNMKNGGAKLKIKTPKYAISRLSGESGLETFPLSIPIKPSIVTEDLLSSPVNNQQSLKSFTPRSKQIKKENQSQSPLVRIDFLDIIRRINTQGKPNIKLDLSKRRISDDDVFPFNYSHFNGATITQLNLSNNLLTSFPSLFLCPTLKTLDLTGNKLTTFLSRSVILSLPNLRHLILDNNSIFAIPDDAVDAMNAIKLTQLSMSDNMLEYLPPNIGTLGHLTSLSLSYNHLKVLPASFVSLTGDIKLQIKGNQLIYPPQELAEQGMSTILRFFGLLKDGDKKSVESSQFKLIVVGHDGAGKTSCIKRLVRNIISIKEGPHKGSRGRLVSKVNDEVFDVVVATGNQQLESIHLHFSFFELENFEDNATTSTIGIDINTWQPSLTADVLRLKGGSEDLLKLWSGFPPNLTISVWDFAGQEIYHAAQEVFFSSQALYFVVWDMNKNEPGGFDKYVQFWIDLIQSRCPGSRILVIGTKGDLLKAPGMVDSKRVEAIENVTANEERRKYFIEQELSEIEDQSRIPLLQPLSKLRPLIDTEKDILTVSSDTGAGFVDLASRIFQLSTPSVDMPNPFGLVCISNIPMYYFLVKSKLRKIVDRRKSFVKMEEINIEINTEVKAQVEAKISASRDSIAALEDVDVDVEVNVEIDAGDDDESTYYWTAQHTRDAIIFLSSIGEVIDYHLCWM